METVPHVVLEYDKWSDCALVALTDDAHSAVRGGTDMPYLVTSGYHRESRTWARATPFGDITRAKVVFEHRVGRDYAPNEGRLHDDEVIACRWRRGDIAGVLEESLDYPIPATKENIDTAIGQIAHVRDRLIEYGWREMVDSIRVERLDLGLGSSQADNFYRGVYDVTAHHNSMFWPSGDGNAVHVSHCRLEDGRKTAPRSDSPSARFRPRQSSTNPSPSRRSTDWVGKSSFAWTVSMRISVKSVPSPAHRPSSALSSTPFAPISRHLAIRSGSKSATSRPTCAKSRSAASASRTRSTRPRRPRRRRAPHSAARRRGRYIEGIRTSN